MLPSITINEVNAVAKNWLSKDNYDKYFALITGPDTKKMTVPTDLELKEIVDIAFQQKVTANQEKVVATSILDKEPTPGKIV